MTATHRTSAIQDYLATLRRFNRDVRLFFLAAMIVGFTNFSGIYVAIGNLFLLRLGYGTQFIGLVNAVSSLALVSACLPVSAMERRFGGRRLILSGLALNIASSFLLPFAGSLPVEWGSAWILGLVPLNSVSMALYMVSAQPFLAGATGPAERGHVFSVQAALWPLSGFLGSLLGGLIPGFIGRWMDLPLTTPFPYQLTLWISAGISIFALVIMSRTRRVAAVEPEVRSPLQVALNPVKVIAFLSIIVAVQITGESGVRIFTNVYLDRALSLPTATIGLVLGLGQMVAALAALLTPFFAARLGHPRTFILASLGISACILPLALIPSPYGAGLGFMGTVMMAQIARPAIITMQMEFVAGPYRSVMAAVTTMAASLSSGLISLLGGYMIPAQGYAAFFLTGASLTALAAVGFAVVMTRRGIR